jgi:hypothetical protein
MGEPMIQPGSYENELSVQPKTEARGGNVLTKQGKARSSNPSARKTSKAEPKYKKRAVSK